MTLQHQVPSKSFTPPVPETEQVTQLAQLQPRGNAAMQEQLRQEPARPRVSSGSFVRQGLRAEVLSLALTAYDNAVKRGDVDKPILTVVDYSLPSDEKRMWVIDLTRGRLLHHVLVSHGSNSGGRNSTSFSNRDGSHQSNLGVMKTGETYVGKHGRSLKLDGLEEGFNDNARSRYIVMHQADYVNDDRARTKSVGRSWGCLAMDPKVAGDVIDTVKNGTLVVSYYPDDKWLRQSEYLQ